MRGPVANEQTLAALRNQLYEQLLVRGMVVSPDLLKLRKAVEKANRALKKAEQRFDADFGTDKAPRLIADIKQAEDDLAEAQGTLHRMETMTAIRRSARKSSAK